MWEGGLSEVWKGVTEVWTMAAFQARLTPHYFLTSLLSLTLPPTLDLVVLPDRCNGSGDGPKAGERDNGNLSHFLPHFLSCQTDVTDLVMAQRQANVTLAQLAEEKERAEALLQVLELRVYGF